MKNKNKRDIILEDEHTINLTWELSTNQKKQMIENRIKAQREIKYKSVIKFLLWVTLVFIIITVGLLIPRDETNALEEVSIATKIRLERLISCENALNKSWIQELFIYEQSLVVRCATYSTLIYAYESGYGQSQKCKLQKNCYGMKWNWVDKPAWFITFDSYKAGRDWFSYKYFQWHYKKKINTFVNNWSMTERDTYKQFMWKNYTNIYNELERLYLTNR